MGEQDTLELVIPKTECWDEITETFITIPSQTLELEHSLWTISKWEAKWKKAFLGKQEKTREEMLDYVRCMTLTENVDPIVYQTLSNSCQLKIKSYIEDKHCATCLPERKDGQGSSDVVTAELIYYWMVALQIPFECQHWHLNRLLTLVQVCNIKNNPKKKHGRGDIMRRNAALNAQRRARHNTKG